PYHVVARALTTDPLARAGLTALAAATAGALAVAGFFRAASARTKKEDALLLALALGTSVLWPYSKCLFSESFSAAALIWAWVFVWPPCLLLALPRMKQDREIAVTGAIGLLVFAKYMFPEGGYCHGPRHLVPIVPLLLLPAARGFSRRALIATVILGGSMN